MAAWITQGILALKAVLCLAVAIWSLNASLRHPPSEALNQVELAQQAVDHGHSHGVFSDLMWSQHGHSHDASDHDHNNAIPPKAGSLLPLADGLGYHLLTAQTFAPPPVFAIDPPPRTWAS